MTTLALKRAPNAGDGTRILVVRLWPRGIARDKARIDLWLKDIAPSDALCKRFHGKSDEWDAFCAAYFAELEGPGASGGDQGPARAPAQGAGHPALCHPRRAPE